MRVASRDPAVVVVGVSAFVFRHFTQDSSNYQSPHDETSVAELRCEHGDSSLGVSLRLNRYLDVSLLGSGLGSV